MVVPAVIAGLRSWRIFKLVASLSYMGRQGGREREGKRKEGRKEKEKGEEKNSFLTVQRADLTMLLS